jgi:hypothetical protein
MIELGVLPTVLDLFFKYEWNNFLHNLVKNLLEIIITGEVCVCLSVSASVSVSAAVAVWLWLCLCVCMCVCLCESDTYTV